MYWKMFTYTTDGIVVENILLYNIMCVIDFVLFYFFHFIHSCGVVMLLMLCFIFISFYFSFHSVCSIIP